MTDTVNIPTDVLVAAAHELTLAGRWPTAALLVDAAENPSDPRLALAAAQVAIEWDWYAGSDRTAARLSEVDLQRLDGEQRWDFQFLQLRQRYRMSLHKPDPELHRMAEELRATAPDAGRLGWAHMYLGLVADNNDGDRATAPAHYTAALDKAGPDDLLRREALRHLGDHDHDRGDHATALARWHEATTAGARSGFVPGTLSQQLLLAVLARDAGAEPAATALATEVARWAAALGAARIADQATAFLAGIDPTAPPAPEPEARRSHTAPPIHR